MIYRFYLCLLVAVLATTSVSAQVRVRTETYRAPVPIDIPPQTFSPTLPGAPAAPAAPKPEAAETTGAIPPRPSPQFAGGLEIITDLARMPTAVARTRDRILTAARAGELQRLLTVMQMNGSLPVFSPNRSGDPIAYWKKSYPDTEGVEVLSILISILETGFVHVDPGTPKEMYIWPYFARAHIKTLRPEQKVELFRIVTGADYREMLESGAYSFYRLGITPDGTWQFFLAGD